jgi:hypothetical protein
MGEEFLQELKVVCYTVVCSYQPMDLSVNFCLVKPFVDKFFCLLLYRYMSGIAIPLPMALQLTNASQQVR